MRRSTPLLTLLVYSVLHWTSIAAPPQQVVGARQRLAVVNFTPSDEPPHAPEGEDATTLIVLAPAPAEGSDAWLSKAIADLLIQYLCEVRSLEILERERMQTFIEEVELGESALFEQERALRVGRVAKVDHVVFGNYRRRGERITITLFLLELESQRVLETEQISGSVERLRSLVKELVLRLLRQRDVTLSEREVEHIRFEATDSITATEHYYRALDLFDQGDYAASFGECMKATRQDPMYLEARLWSGRLFAALGHHAHAVAACRRLYAAHPARVEALDAFLLAGRLLQEQLGLPEEAVAVYAELAGRKPVTPHALEASFRLGTLLFERGKPREAYEAFAIVDALRERWSGCRTSRVP